MIDNGTEYHRPLVCSAGGLSGHFALATREEACALAGGAMAEHGPLDNGTVTVRWGDEKIVLGKDGFIGARSSYPRASVDNAQ